MFPALSRNRQETYEPMTFEPLGGHCVISNFQWFCCCVFQIGEREGSVKPSWESIHPMATVLPLSLRFTYYLCEDPL